MRIKNLQKFHPFNLQFHNQYISLRQDRGRNWKAERQVSYLKDLKGRFIAAFLFCILPWRSLGFINLEKSIFLSRVIMSFIGLLRA
jgi:hypothetical protein